MMRLALLAWLLLGSAVGVASAQPTATPQPDRDWQTKVDDGLFERRAGSALEFIVVLVDQRRAIPIVVPVGCSAQLQLAAEELQTFLGRMSGGEVPIVTDAALESPSARHALLNVM